MFEKVRLHKFRSLAPTGTAAGPDPRALWRVAVDDRGVRRRARCAVLLHNGDGAAGAAQGAQGDAVPRACGHVRVDRHRDLVEICPRPRVLHIAPAIVCGEDGYRPAYLRLCANLFYFGGRQKIPPPAVPERRSMGPLEPFLGTNIFLIYRN